MHKYALYQNENKHLPIIYGFFLQPALKVEHWVKSFLEVYGMKLKKNVEVVAIAAADNCPLQPPGRLFVATGVNRFTSLYNSSETNENRATA